MDVSYGPMVLVKLCTWVDFERDGQLPIFGPKSIGALGVWISLSLGYKQQDDSYGDIYVGVSINGGTPKMDAL